MSTVSTGPPQRLPHYPDIRRRDLLRVTGGWALPVFCSGTPRPWHLFHGGDDWFSLLLNLLLMRLPSSLTLLTHLTFTEVQELFFFYTVPASSCSDALVTRSSCPVVRRRISLSLPPDHALGIYGGTSIFCFLFFAAVPECPGVLLS